jgi:hypothetical protein
MAASRVACASFNLGTNTTITITRDKKTYTHTISWKFGSASGTVATKTTQTSIVWSPNAATLYAQIPSAVSGYGTITCQTYDGNTLVGTTTAGFYAYAVKTNCLPTVTAAIVDTNAATIAVTGNSSKLVRYISKPKVTMTATAKNSATIKTRQIYNPVGLTATTSPYTFNTVYSDEFRVKATDSRGYTTETKYNVGFVEYDPVHFNSVSLKRTESTSTTATATLKGFCFNGSFGAVNNTLTLKYRYKTPSTSYGSYVSIAVTTWNADGSFVASAPVSGLSLSEQYTFEFVAEDKLTSFISDEVVLSIGSGDMRIGKDYIQFRNNVVIGDANNTEWKRLQVRRKVGGGSYSGNVGIAAPDGLAALALEFYQGNEMKGRTELRADGFMHNYLHSMSFAEMSSLAPSVISGSVPGYMILNAGDSDPILIQWGRVNVTPSAANTVTSLKVNFLYQYGSIPFVCSDRASAAPATVFSNVGDITTTGFTVYLQRTNTTMTSIPWMAIGNGSPSLPE